MPVEKNKEYVVEIIDNGFEGEGIAKIKNFNCKSFKIIWIWQNYRTVRKVNR